MKTKGSYFFQFSLDPKPHLLRDPYKVGKGGGEGLDRWGKMLVGIILQLVVMVDESIREIERSEDEEESKDDKSDICQLLNQWTASQRRDKSCAPSH